jgi:hypothetical protein
MARIYGKTIILARLYYTRRVLGPWQPTGSPWVGPLISRGPGPTHGSPPGGSSKLMGPHWETYLQPTFNRVRNSQYGTKLLPTSRAVTTTSSSSSPKSTCLAENLGSCVCFFLYSLVQWSDSCNLNRWGETCIVGNFGWMLVTCRGTRSR